MSDNNVAIFEVRVRVALENVPDNELNNSEVLHPDVLNRVKELIDQNDAQRFEITLDEVVERFWIGDDVPSLNFIGPQDQDMLDNGYPTAGMW